MRTCVLSRLGISMRHVHELSAFLVQSALHARHPKYVKPRGAAGVNSEATPSLMPPSMTAALAAGGRLLRAVARDTLPRLVPARQRWRLSIEFFCAPPVAPQARFMTAVLPSHTVLDVTSL